MKRERELVLNLSVDWRVLLVLAVLVGLAALLTSGARAQGPPTPNDGVEAAESEVRAMAVESGAATAQFVTLRSYYVTNANFTGDEVLAACAAGYHAASLWEIYDTTDLAYAYSHPDAQTLADSAWGPPIWWGWVRTGGDPSAANTAGQANCNAWTTGQSGTYGTLVRPNSAWTGASTTISPWQTQTWSCAGIAPVWCVQD